MRILLIANSAASSVTARRRVVIHKALSADHEVEMVVTVRSGHADRLARAAASEGMDVVVALGGDGTLNEVANGLVGTDTSLAVLPGGSTNVFSRIIGVPRNPVDAVGWLLDALARNAVSRIGLGVVGGRYFLFNCGIGFDAAVVRRVEEHGEWKRWAGHPLFVYTAMRTWAPRQHRRRPPIAVVDADGELLSRGRLVLVLNVNPYTFLGNRGIDLVPEATLSAPLVVVTLPSLSLLRLVPSLVRALSVGDVRGKFGATVHTGQHHLQVTAALPFPYQHDGDYLGETSQLELSWSPDVLNLVYG